ncbi:hypothetical protein ZOSMA_256G00070 [Zostera marina]|uniref:non-specific serine/threonine protein kinase n=1 Tax=Zostera marina TaxID=29655 RepID=A0A0K9PFW3_ZOSMR|nr:hypothetical protein ZOSMA_256G00070 [Zostera marina]
MDDDKHYHRLFLVPILMIIFLDLLSTVVVCDGGEFGFTFNGFSGANLSCDGMADITPEGILRLTNATKNLMGHAFYPETVAFRRSVIGNVLSFSTTFVFTIRYTQMSGHGIAFVVSPKTNFSTATPNQYLGIFNSFNVGNSTNHIFAVELDTIKNPEFEDIDTNHVGVDLNGLTSLDPHTAGFYRDEDGVFVHMNLIDPERMQVWVDYDAESTQMDVTMSRFGTVKPKKPLISVPVNLSRFFSETDMYVGFSSTTGPFLSSHYVLGWSFQIEGKSELVFSRVPSLPSSRGPGPFLTICLPIISSVTFLSLVGFALFVVMTKMKFSELKEDWEKDYGTSRFSYKVLYEATNGFVQGNFLGSGGFGSVYGGFLPTSKTKVAVKRVSHESRQGIKEFVAEIVSIGRARHRNLVQLLGYSRRKRELLLVYEYMSNGSLDKFLFDQSSPVTLDWYQRFRIIKGVSAGLFYLHYEWEQVVIHRDIKASNVLLDSDMNGRLGDFGLARLYDHGSDPHTTHVVGTTGYVAPELFKTCKATKSTDVFSFGIFLLEVVTGRRPLDPSFAAEEMILTEWVLEAWKRDEIGLCVDPKIGNSSNDELVAEEIDMVLKLGLLCSHRLESVRPNMRHVIQLLNGDIRLPKMSPCLFDSKSFKTTVKDYYDSDRQSVNDLNFLTDSILFTGR